MCTAGYPSVPAVGSISYNIPPPPKAKDAKVLVAQGPSARAAPVVVVSLTDARVTSGKTKTVSSSPKNFEAAFGDLASQYGFGGAAPQPVSSLSTSSSSEKSKKKSWLKPLF